MYKIYSNKWGILKLYARKILLIMRLTTVILIASLLQVSATSLAQKITYVKKGVTLNMVLKEINKQTGVNLVWNEKKINTAVVIDADFKKATLEEVLDKCFNNLPIKYSIRGKVVAIEEKEPSLRDKLANIFKSNELRGRVLGENNEPLSGATIKIKGTNITAITNAKGEFVLKNADEKAVLVISYLGYDVREINAAENLAAIKLTISSDRLDEVEINAGYYTVKDRDRTGSISRVSAKTIAQQPVNNSLMALQGRVAGLQITQTTGLPGGDFKVRIRGQNSIASGNDPLYIIDGVNYPSSGIAGTNTNFALGTTGNVSPLSLINPNDIESIEILKDADATAIYGSRGANGVILITTKKGKQGNTRIDAAVSYGVNQVGHKLDLLNTDEYLQMRREAFKNDGLTPTATDYDLNTWDQNKYTDWQKELIGDNATTINTSLNISGGSNKSSYLIAGNYYKEGTVFPGDFGFERAGIRSSIYLGNNQDRFSAIFTANLNHTKNLLPGDGVNGPISFIYLPPNAPDLYDKDGQFNWANNTVGRNAAAAMMITSDAQTDNLIGNLILNYRILSNLTFKTSLGYTTIKRLEFLKRPLSSLNPATNPLPTQRESYFGNNYNNSLIFEPQLTYEKSIGKGKFNVLVGASLQDNNSKIGVIRASNFTSDDLMENIGSASTIANDQNEFTQYRYLAFFGRLNYSLNDKYFVNLTARRDGSSRFGSGKQFANFGAVGAAWIFSDEEVIKDNLSFLSFGKLRTSYGLTGNDQISNYGYLDLWNTFNVYNGNSTLTPSAFAPNADFAWETNRKLEAALQLGFLNQRVNFEFSYYRNRSSNQLLRENLPLSSSKLFVFRNIPAEIQNTGLEFELNYKFFSNKTFQWSANINLTVPKNKLLSYPGLETSINASLFKVGEPLNILKAHSVSVNKEAGVYSFEDRDGDGNITNSDRYIILSLDQSYYGGLQNSLSYKGFSLDVHLAFVKQNGRSFNTGIAPGRWLFGFNSNQLSDVLERWQQVGDETSIQKFSTTSANNTLNSNKNTSGNLSVVDASFVRLKNVALSWSFPKHLLSSIKISNASLKLQGQNLFTITKYKGLDPETQGNTNMPPLRTVMIGLNVTF